MDKRNSKELCFFFFKFAVAKNCQENNDKRKEKKPKSSYNYFYIFYHWLELKINICMKFVACLQCLCCLAKKHKTIHYIKLSNEIKFLEKVIRHTAALYK